MKKRFSVEQMVGILKQAEVGVPVAEVIRKAGISEQTFYRWKAKYAGLEVDQVRRRLPDAPPPEQALGRWQARSPSEDRRRRELREQMGLPQRYAERPTGPQPPDQDAR